MARKPAVVAKDRAPRRARIDAGVSIRPTPRARGSNSNLSPDSPNVSHLRADLAPMLPIYHMIRDCLLGELAMKQHDQLWARGTILPPFGMSEYQASNLYLYNTLPYIKQYLPKPNPANMSADNVERYRNYISRAVFYNVTRNTLSGLVGAVFIRKPVIALPPQLEPIEADVTGTGVSLIQLAKQAVQYVVAYGRTGILVDFPSTDGPVTVARAKQERMHATVQAYPPWAVVNWRMQWMGGKQQLAMVVIAEVGVIDDDGFKEETVEQYRVLRLLPTGYQAEIWRRSETDAGMMEIYQTIVPTDASGKTFDYIPFTFVGPEDNSVSVDSAPLADLASLNIGHYRNSADLEESSYLVGQPTPMFSGLTEDWVNNVMGGRVELGSRASVLLPVGGKGELLQADPNTVPHEAMQHKEAQMKALGARLVEEKRVQRTATEAGIDEAAAQSTLASSANNASQAILWALQQCCVFEGVAYTDDTLKFELNTEFDLIKPSPESRKQLLTEYEAGAIAWEEYRHNMRRSGIVTMDDDKAQQSIKDNPPQAAALVQAQIEKTATNDKVAP